MGLDVQDELYRMGLRVIAALWRTRRGRGLVLCFHSISDPGADHPGEMSVGTAFLAEMITALRRSGIAILSLSDAILDLQQDDAGAFVCLTFDDAYKGVYTHAFPVLKRLEAPFTIFVTTDLVDARMPLWWDAIERLAAYSETIVLPKRCVRLRHARGALRRVRLTCRRFET